MACRHLPVAVKEFMRYHDEDMYQMKGCLNHGAGPIYRLSTPKKNYPGGPSTQT